MYREDWAIANVANLGPDFTLVSGTQQRIVSEAAVGAASGSSAGYYRYNVGKMASDHMRVDAGLITPPAGTLNSGIAAFILARMPDTFATGGAAGTYVAGAITSGGAWAIQSVNQTTFTSRASGNIGTITLPGVLTLIAAGPLYVLLWNGSVLGSWTDANNTIAGIGASKRNWGVIVQCSATNQQHPGIDWMCCHDLAGRAFAA
ncbi:DUF7257 domain-containing protein [Nocardia otitidiscaviarum]|uniref:DUF7257 domain-containing protein n=1 Tax=Nocardia otitidiscaviarum TaxID=1823 RepID=UPI0004A7414A|nr:hypothetical protein [Nocardia otitidiscaviarum]